MLKLKSSNDRMGTGASAQARSGDLRTGLSQFYEKVDDAIRAEAPEVEEKNENTVDAEVHRTMASKKLEKSSPLLLANCPAKRAMSCSLKQK